MSRLILAALVMISATPAFAGTATTTMSVGVIVLPYDPPVGDPPVGDLPPPANPAPNSANGH